MKPGGKEPTGTKEKGLPVESREGGRGEGSQKKKKRVVNSLERKKYG